MSQPKAYLEHVAVFVRDIHWHIRFFEEVFGMTMREVDGTTEAPRQYWTLGGMQFIHQPDFSAEGRLGHLGIMCEDVEASLAAARRYDVQPMPQVRTGCDCPMVSPSNSFRRNPRAAWAGARHQSARGGMT